MNKRTSKQTSYIAQISIDYKCLILTDDSTYRYRSGHCKRAAMCTAGQELNCQRSTPARYVCDLLYNKYIHKLFKHILLQCVSKKN